MEKIVWLPEKSDAVLGLLKSIVMQYLKKMIKNQCQMSRPVTYLSGLIKVCS